MIPKKTYYSVRPQGLRRPFWGRLGAAASVILVSMTLFSTASATPLLPGGILFPAPAGLINGGALFNAPLLNIPFVSPTFTGTLTSEVFKNDPTNPFGGGLTFVYQITNTSPFAGEIDRLTVNNYLGFGTNAIYVAGTGAQSPGYIDRSANGATVGFSFAQIPLGFGVLNPGQTSDLLVVYTDATNAGTTLASVIDGSVAQVQTYAPVPEPRTLCLAGLASIGLLSYARRRI